MIDITQYLTDDLRQPQYRGHPNPVAGHCYVACEALYHLYPGDFHSYYIRHENQSHWFLIHRTTKEVIDPTAAQFNTPVPYAQGKRKGFLTKQPSKRTQKLLSRVV